MKNLYKIIMIVFFFAIITIIPVVSLLTMPREEFAFSENENRYLARFPRFSAAGFESTEFMKGFEDWANDRVFGREVWIRLKNNTERLLGKLETSGVYIADGRMLQAWRDDSYNDASVNRNLEAVNTFAARHGDIPMYFMLAPTSVEVYRDSLPVSAPVGSQKEFIKYCYDRLTELTNIDVLSLMDEHAGKYIYYRTDHHWAAEGSYIAYTAAAHAMGFTPLELSRFSVENVSNSFLGTLHSKTLYNSITPDIIKIYTLSEGDPDVSVTINDGLSETMHGSLYFREYLDVKDKYSVYLSAPVPVVRIESDLSGMPRRLLVIKDSFAHSLVPFLAKNFSEITMADMRFINQHYSEVFDVSEFDAVLFVYNVITFSEDTHLVKLGRE
ncbi:MAG: DHHW family protein [Oscillospiraceae bacterium]|nr:DHHW family protein [Oscillospiraceae bacterium]